MDWGKAVKQEADKLVIEVTHPHRLRRHRQLAAAKHEGLGSTQDKGVEFQHTRDKGNGAIGGRLADEECGDVDMMITDRPRNDQQHHHHAQTTNQSQQQQQQAALTKPRQFGHNLSSKSSTCSQDPVSWVWWAWHWVILDTRLQCCKCVAPQSSG